MKIQKNAWKKGGTHYQDPGRPGTLGPSGPLSSQGPPGPGPEKPWTLSVHFKYNFISKFSASNDCFDKKVETTSVTPRTIYIYIFVYIKL